MGSVPEIVLCPAIHWSAAVGGSKRTIGGGGTAIEIVRVAVGSLSRIRGRNSAAYLQTNARFDRSRRSYWRPALANFRFREVPRTMWLESLAYSKKAEYVFLLPKVVASPICAFAAETRTRRTARLATAADFIHAPCAL